MQTNIEYIVLEKLTHQTFRNEYVMSVHDIARFFGEYSAHFSNFERLFGNYHHLTACKIS